MHDWAHAKLKRDIDEEVRDRVRALANTEASQESRRERKKIEMVFAHVKHILEARPAAAEGLERCARRGSACRHRPKLEKACQSMSDDHRRWRQPPGPREPNSRRLSAADS